MEKNLYICICNSLTSKKVKEAVHKGVSNYKNVYSYYNCQPKCGKCLEVMSDVVNDTVHTTNAPNY